jgi:hypothetical protein
MSPESRISTLPERQAAGAAARPPTAPPAPPPPPGPGLLARARTWAGAHKAGILLLAGLLVVTGAVHAAGMGSAPQYLDDEGTYVAQAWAVQQWHTLGHYTYWYDHPPLGWILIAAYTWLTGAFDRAAAAVAAGREFMLLAHLVSSALVYLVARRAGLRQAAAAVAVLLFGLSPLALHYHRMVLLDNLATPLTLAAFALAASPSRRLAAHAASGLCFGAAVLCKETFLLLLPVLAWQLCRNGDQRTRRYSLATAGSLFVLVGLVYVLYATLRGELLPGGGHVSLLEGVRFQLFDREAGGSLFDSDSGTGRTLRSWLGLDPWLLGIGILLMPAGLAIARLRPLAAALGLLTLAMLRPGYLPVPFVVGMLPFAALLAAGVPDHLVRRLAMHRRAAEQDGATPAPKLAGQPAVLVAGAVCVAAAILVVPSWVAGDRALITTDQDAPRRQAEAWVAENVDRTRSVMVDGSLWVDLVRRGFPPERVVWFYKLDTDDDVRARYPNGSRDLHFVVSTPSMRSFPENLPEARNALERSRVVKTFGHGDQRVEVRQVSANGGG